MQLLIHLFFFFQSYLIKIFLNPFIRPLIYFSHLTLKLQKPKSGEEDEGEESGYVYSWFEEKRNIPNSFFFFLFFLYSFGWGWGKGLRARAQGGEGGGVRIVVDS